MQSVGLFNLSRERVGIPAYTCFYFGCKSQAQRSYLVAFEFKRRAKMRPTVNSHKRQKWAKPPIEGASPNAIALYSRGEEAAFVTSIGTHLQSSKTLTDNHHC